MAIKIKIFILLLFGSTTCFAEECVSNVCINFMGEMLEIPQGYSLNFNVAAHREEIKFDKIYYDEKRLIIQSELSVVSLTDCGLFCNNDANDYAEKKHFYSNTDIASISWYLESNDEDRFISVIYNDKAAIFIINDNKLWDLWNMKLKLKKSH